MVRAVDVPVTLKIRTGWDRDNRNGVTVAKLAEQAGIQALAVHGRTRADLYTGRRSTRPSRRSSRPCRYRCSPMATSIRRKKARKVIEQTGVDALLIGRAAQEDRGFSARSTITCGPASTCRRAASKCRASCSNTSRAALLWEEMGVRIARKHVGWYLATLPGAREFRAQFNRLQDTDAQCASVEQFFAERQNNGTGVAA
ncbi:tRNA-dihydrouridine synthase [Pseudomonas aeruginosa]|nr:tRNA-dihydrouridine synthase [Pseudomonas aeruginosa]